MLIERTRSRIANSQWVTNSGVDRVNSILRYSKYKDPNFGKVTTRLSAPKTSASGVFKRTITDYVHKPGTPSKWISPPSGNTMADYYADNNPFKFCSNSISNLIQHPLNPVATKSTASHDVALTFSGLPYECIGYWAGTGSFVPSIHSMDDTFRFGIEPIFESFAKMNRDSSLLGLHDQNLFTSIGELKDFRKTIETVTKHRIGGKYPADKYLGVNFGILPFYSDVKNYIDNWNNFAPSLKKWNDIGNKKDKVLNSHRTFFKKVKEVVSDQLYSGSFNWPDGLTTYRYRFEYTTEYTLIGKTHIYFKPKPLESDNKLELIASINGLKQPLSAVWNLIPFSFVVDWFTNTGDLIANLERTKPTLRYDIVSAGYSMRLHRVTTCQVFLVDNSSGSEWDLGYSIRDVEYFRRYPYLPSQIIEHVFDRPINSPFEFTPELTGYQWSLAAALAVTLTKK